jgi:RimJ/RimL family protein N-acetyltransferase
MGYGWEGDKVRLVPLDKARHLDHALAWLNDPEVTAWTAIGDLPLCRLAEEEFFDRVMRAVDTDLSLAIETLAGDHIGFSGLHRIEWRHGTAWYGIVLGRKDLWGKGYGVDSCRVQARYAFEALGLRLLLAQVMDGNTASLAMLRRTGYQEVGRLPRFFWKRGAFRDVALLALERLEPAILNAAGRSS